MLEKAKDPSEDFIKELKVILCRIFRKLHKLKNCKMNLDKLNFFMALEKGHTSKIYNFAIRMQFLRIKHPSLNTDGALFLNGKTE